MTACLRWLNLRGIKNRWPVCRLAELEDNELVADIALRERCSTFGRQREDLVFGDILERRYLRVPAQRVRTLPGNMHERVDCLIAIFSEVLHAFLLCGPKPVILQFHLTYRVLSVVLKALRIKLYSV